MSACPCGRKPRGFAWHKYGQETIPACSMQCLSNLVRDKNKGLTMAEITKTLDAQEFAGIIAASKTCGGILESMGKTDLAQMTQEEWLDFLAGAYAAICAQVAQAWTDEVPF